MDPFWILLISWLLLNLAQPGMADLGDFLTAKMWCPWEDNYSSCYLAQCVAGVKWYRNADSVNPLYFFDDNRNMTDNRYAQDVLCVEVNQTPPSDYSHIAQDSEHGNLRLISANRYRFRACTCKPTVLNRLGALFTEPKCTAGQIEIQCEMCQSAERVFKKDSKEALPFCQPASKNFILKIIGGIAGGLACIVALCCLLKACSIQCRRMRDFCGLCQGSGREAEEESAEDPYQLQMSPADFEMAVNNLAISQMNSPYPKPPNYQDVVNAGEGIFPPVSASAPADGQTTTTTSSRAARKASRSRRIREEDEGLPSYAEAVQVPTHPETTPVPTVSVDPSGNETHADAAVNEEIV